MLAGAGTPLAFRDIVHTIASETVNDIQSLLNETVVHRVAAVRSLAAIQEAIRGAAEAGLPVATAGGRHAMGGQQFCAGGLLIDTRSLDSVLSFDQEAGTIEVEAGLQWPGLIDYLARRQEGEETQWGIAQKQTGADRLSIGGAIAANVHGRGLTMKPFISDVESFVLVGPDGDVSTCSRDENADLFALASGGYGLFGCLYSARLRLLPRRVLERVVEVDVMESLSQRFEERIADGFVYGDFQFATDAGSDDFLRRGVFSCYRPTEHEGPLPADQRGLSRDDWNRLIYLAHTDKARAFALYSEHYLGTTGQLYFSDAHQFADYKDGYHADVDALRRTPERRTEMISELYVPRDRLADFMAAVAGDFREHDVDVIYGTIRLIERDDEAFLAWAREAWACVIFNLCTPHTSAGIARTAAAFQRLIDLALERGGSYYLTYHRWARRDQVAAAHPRFAEFLQKKLEHDPAERFQSEWYRHYRALFASS